MNLSPLYCAVVAALIAVPATAEEAVEFGEVVVTANKTKQPLSKTAGSVAVITSETLEREGVTELYDALDKEPGVSVTGGAGQAQNFVIRGMTGNRIAVIQDGIPATDGFGANDLNDVAGRNAFDLGEIKQLEVVKGASSSVHGSGAIGGVVVLTSKTPEDYLKGKDLHLDVSTLYSGISDKFRGASSLAFRQGNFDSLIRVSGWTGEETKNHQENLYNRDIEGYSAAYTLYHYLTDSLLIKGKASFYREDVNRVEGSALVQPDGLWGSLEYYEDVRTETAQAYVGLEHDQDSGWYRNLELKGYWRLSTQDTFRNVLMARKQNGITEQRRQVENRSFEDEVVGLNLALNHQLTFAQINHDLAYGLEFSNTRHARPVSKQIIDWNGAQPSESKPFVPANTYTGGLYFRDEISWHRWRLTPGVRFDMHRLSPDGEHSVGGFKVSDSDSSELSPSLSVAYHWTPEWNTYLSYNHGYRAASYNRVYGYAPHLFNPFEPFILVPNLDLKAETSDAFELGSKYADDTWQFYAAVFYNDYRDFIDVLTVGMITDENDPNRGSYLKQYVNLDKVETYGFEMSLSQILSPQWSWTAKAGVVSGKDDNDEYVRAITPWEGNVQLDYDEGPLSAYTRLNWAAAMNKTPSCVSSIGIGIECASTSGWVTLDMGATYRFDFGLDLSVNLKNMLDKEYVRYQDVAGLGPSQLAYSSQPGRYVTVNATMEF